MKKIPKNSAASILARLKNVSKERGLDHTQTLTQYAIERLLYRLSLSQYRDRFVLKGAMLFVLWEDNAFRTTRDLDLLGYGEITIETVRVMFQEVAGIEAPEDFLLFDPNSIEVAEIRALEEYVGVRVSLRASIEKARIKVQVDIGVGDSVAAANDNAMFPTLIDLPAPTLQAYSKESVMAEKFHAIWRLGMLNTRMKDYYDLFHLISHYEFDGQRVYEAIEGTFSRRGTSLDNTLPAGLAEEFLSDTTKQTQWKAFLRKSKLSDASPDLEVVVAALVRFLKPLLAACVKDAPLEMRWGAGKWSKTI